MQMIVTRERWPSVRQAFNSDFIEILGDAIILIDSQWLRNSVCHQIIRVKKNNSKRVVYIVVEIRSFVDKVSQEAYFDNTMKKELSY